MTSSTDPRRRHRHSRHGTGLWGYPGITPWRDVATLVGGVWHPRLAGTTIEVSRRTVERAVAGYRRLLAVEAKATLRFETPPGRQLQIDFGEARVQIAGEPTNRPVRTCSW